MAGKKLLYLEPRQATWLELFFDLIFVVALGKLTHFLVHTHHGHLEGHVWFSFILTFIPMWWIWVGHMVYSNRFDSDSRPHRVVTLLLMAIIMLCAITLKEDLAGSYVPFMLAYGTARLIIAVLYFSAAGQYPEKKGFAKSMGLTFTIGALISMSAVFFTFSFAIVIFYLGILFDIVGRQLIVKHVIPVDRDHLVERVGLLAIILLGESVISISYGLSDMNWDTLTTATVICGFLFICMIWWMYFDSFPLLIESERDKNGDAILFSQLSTYISFAVLANMIRHAILGDLAISDFRIMVMVGVGTFYFGKQTAYYVNRPEYRGYIILNTLVMFVIAILALFLPKPQYILFGAAFSKLVYIAMNFRAQRKLYGKVHL
ncbi:MAG: low temperature requirement protein A [Desulfobacterales bacterium]|nr:low temperature requirement protein A [Desulfobacterales bacterium]